MNSTTSDCSLFPMNPSTPANPQIQAPGFRSQRSGAPLLHSAAKPQLNCAKSLERVELAPAVEIRGSLKAGARSTHSKRFATTHAPKISAACDLFRLLERSRPPHWRFLWCSLAAVFCTATALPSPHHDSPSTDSRPKDEAAAGHASQSTPASLLFRELNYEGRLTDDEASFVADIAVESLDELEVS